MAQAAATPLGCARGDGLLCAATAPAVAFEEAVEWRAGRDVESLLLQGGEEAQPMTPKTETAAGVVMGEAVVVEVVVVVVVRHGAHGEFACVARKGFSADRIGLGLFRHRGETAMTRGKGDGTESERAELGSYSAGLVGR